MKQKEEHPVQLVLQEGVYELVIPGAKPIMIYVPKQKTGTLTKTENRSESQ